MPPIEDHPQRYAHVNELHARPFPAMSCPCTVTYLAVKQRKEAVHRDRMRDMAHLTALLERYGAPLPQPGATHHAVQIGRYHLKWEQHTEFVTYTLFSPGISARPFDPVDFEVFPQDWLEEAPGVRIASVAIRVVDDPGEEAIKAALGDWFEPESLAVSDVLGGSATAAGDFRIDPAGQMRFAVFVKEGTGIRRIGRIVQRICEVETYRAMSMFGFSRARGLAPDIGALDSHLSSIMAGMSGSAAPPEQTLTQLLAVSAELETMAAHTSFRFAATGAYEALVNQRISLLRETRHEGYQTFAEFMLRRYEPAMRTVKSTQQRLTTLADRARRAGELLRTRVDVGRSAQNQALLESMDRRADQALRLQHTVEGLSVVAISYYGVSLASYALYPLATALDMTKGTLTAAITLPVVAAVWLAVRRIRKKFH